MLYIDACQNECQYLRGLMKHLQDLAALDHILVEVGPGWKMIEWRLSQTCFFLNLPVQSKDRDPDAILDKLYIVHQLIAEKRRFVC